MDNVSVAGITVPYGIFGQDVAAFWDDSSAG
jgi:hypothetical protein